MGGSLRIRTVKEGKDLLEKDPVLRRIVEIIVKEIDPDKIILFGSRARGDYTEGSDYDILVLKEGVRPEDRGKWEMKVEMALLREGIFTPADVIVQDAVRYENLKNRMGKVYYSVSREGILVYERRRGKRVA